MIMICVSV